jgi:choice-of-anchor B domain-containing protein
MTRTCLICIGWLVVSCAEFAFAAQENCVDGRAGEFPCSKVDLLSHLTLSELGGGSGNDLWGWKDPDTGRYYAIMSLSTRTTFVDVTDPVNPVIVGDLRRSTLESFTRDIKVYANHAYIVSDARDSGMQVFDLTRLRDAASGTAFSADAVYRGQSTAHNIAINEQTGFAYLVGSDSGDGQCGGGLHILDISAPKSPVQVGCYGDLGRIHDAQCVIYQGPDQEFQGVEICFASVNLSLSIIDVSNKSNPVRLGQVTWPNAGFAHQGWLTEDQRYFLMGDEGDEANVGVNTRTLVLDVNDLRQPVYVGAYLADTLAIDHNLYIKGNYTYQANYSVGMRILRIDNLAEAELTEVAWFDTFPINDDFWRLGAWTAYPFFDNGTLLVSDATTGLFMLRAVGLGDTSQITPGLNGNWWNGPARSGEGAQIEVADDGGGGLVFVATVYSYDTAGNQIFLVAVGPVNGSSADVEVFITEGGAWGDNFDPALVNETHWGTGTFTASSCDAMHMSLMPNAEFQGIGYTNLAYDLIRLTTPAIPCPIEN